MLAFHIIRNKTLLAILLSGDFQEGEVQRQGLVSTTTGKPQGEPGYCEGYNNSCGHPLQCYGASAPLSLPATTNHPYGSYLLMTPAVVLSLLPLGFYLLHSLCLSSLLSILISVDFLKLCQIFLKIICQTLFYHPLLVLRLSIACYGLDINCWSSQVWSGREEGSVSNQGLTRLHFIGKFILGQSWLCRTRNVI